jgi:hypothetical protein
MNLYRDGSDCGWCRRKNMGMNVREVKFPVIMWRVWAGK